MKIIRIGEKKRKSKRFRCNNCRSVFVADFGEYNTEKYPHRPGNYYSSRCPVCNKVTYKLS